MRKRMSTVVSLRFNSTQREQWDNTITPLHAFPFVIFVRGDCITSLLYLMPISGSIPDSPGPQSACLFIPFLHFSCVALLLVS
jgi:hypothetical protein